MKRMLFIHGWGQSRRIWQQQLAAFPHAAFANLPGHGGTATLPLEQWTNALLQAHPAADIIVGWSLGGILAMQMALQQSARIRGLVLVASTPCFCRRPDWAHACADDVFAGFEQAVDTQAPSLMSRFFALMLHGENIPRTQYRSWARDCVDRKHPPQYEALRQGLTILKHTDLRAQLTQIRCPVLLMHGEQDAVVPFGAGRYLAGHLPQARLQHFAPCGHAPFLSHANTFNTCLEEWCQNI